MVVGGSALGVPMTHPNSCRGTSTNPSIGSSSAENSWAKPESKELIQTEHRGACLNSTGESTADQNWRCANIYVRIFIYIHMYIYIYTYIYNIYMHKYKSYTYNIYMTLHVYIYIYIINIHIYIIIYNHMYTYNIMYLICIIFIGHNIYIICVYIYI